MSLLGSCMWEFWMELKKIKFKASLNNNTINNFEEKKRIVLICVIEIISILAHAKTQLNQAGLC